MACDRTQYPCPGINDSQTSTFAWPNPNLPWHHGRYQFTPPRPDLREPNGRSMPPAPEETHGHR